MNRVRVRQYLQAFDFQTLFIEEMGWSNVQNSKSSKLTLPDSTIEYQQRAIAQLSGVTVYEISAPKGDFPDAKTRKALHKVITQTAYENLLIFLDTERTRSLWYWVKRDGKKEQPREHLYMQGQPGDLFLSKLDSMVIELDDLRPDGTIPITAVTSRLAASLDIEKVTKKFYTEFSKIRLEFTDLINGISHEADRTWYASVLLNRLMFIYFLQKKGFIDGGNGNYLSDKLAASQGRGQDRFYSEFLHLLFFEGFAKPSDQRSALAHQLLGQIRYLNGGLFLQHPLEQKYAQISIPDQAFENLLALFGRYSWHLDDTPGANDNEISPDVLGYIFEKYINQKAFGAYYTRSEITTYLCERTIHAVILEKINAVNPKQFASLEELLLRLDDDLCRRLLNEVLPKLSVLDPACGSGAFLVAAMKTLLNIYAAVFGKVEFSNDRNLTQFLKKVRADHASVNYYIRKRIITDNLYGVDIMQEAAEIAKLRLFLSLVASVQTVDQLEPLPNIDFNIMTGNSLIGLLKVDESRLAGTGTISYLEQAKIDEYKHQLAEKNRLVQLYRESSSQTEDLSSIRQKIDAHKASAYAALNKILLDDFQSLKIKYEQALPNGKSEKRALVINDIEILQPFHWGYEFDEIMGRGGFDVLIANPPWEVVQTSEKEFFRQYDQLIQKNKITIKDWENQKEKLLQNPEIQDAWLEYTSQFPHQWNYFKQAAQYSNQTTRVEGKQAGNKPNLYNLFTEQNFNLLRQGGETGIVIPSGIYTDFGTRQLREMLFKHTQITGLFGFENRKEIFEGVHRSFKFVVLTYQKGRQTESFPAAFMRHEVGELERFPSQDSLLIDIDLVQRISPDSLSIPEFKTEIDLSVAKKMLKIPLLADPHGWGLELYGEELNMTRSSKYFKNFPTSSPVYEGSMIWHFDHKYAEPRYWVEEKELRQSFLEKRVKRIEGLSNLPQDMRNDYEVYRIAIRKIARNTDTRTIISSIIPPYSFTGNSLSVNFPFFHDRNKYNTLHFSMSASLILVTLLNSFAVDYVLRSRMSANLNLFYLYQLPIPRLSKGERFFEAIVQRAARLICTTPEFDDLAKEVGLGSHQARATNPVERAKLRAELDGMVAHLYNLTESEFSHILGTFPLVGEPVKVAAINAYRDVERGLIG